MSTKIGNVGEALQKANQNEEKTISEFSDNNFVVKGPMGEGLRIRKAGGTHVVFCAGTGVLCYLDIITHVILKNLRLIPES